MAKIGRGGKSRSVASQEREKEKDPSEHVSEIITKMGYQGR